MTLCSRGRQLALVLLAVLIATGAGAGDGTYQQPTEFIAEVFSGDPPPSRTVWYDDALKNELARALGHAPRGMRARYWGRDGRTVWILEEIGKTQPITTGVVINRGAIEAVRVLVFRESRGWEVKHAFFTDQFKQARLDDTKRLSQPIDGITGATLSVRALKKVATAALLLHAHSDEANLTLAKSE